MAVSIIGNYDFVYMDQPPMVYRQSGFVEMRAGIRDHAFWRTAERGVPFQVSTFRDVVSYDSTTALTLAQALFREYENLIFADPQVFSYAGGTYSQNGVELKVIVLDVQAPQIQRTLSRVGGISPSIGATDSAFVRANWTLVFTEVDPPP